MGIWIWESYNDILLLKFRKMENELLHQKMILQLSWFDTRTIWLFESQKVVDLEIDESLNLFIEVEMGWNHKVNFHLVIMRKVIIFDIMYQ